MTDTDHDGISDEVEAAVAAAEAQRDDRTFAQRALRLVQPRDLLVGLIALSLASLGIAIARAAAPDSSAVKAVGTWFAGSACTEVEDERDRYRDAWSCIEGAGNVPELCAAKLETDADPDH